MMTKKPKAVKGFALISPRGKMVDSYVNKQDAKFAVRLFYCDAKIIPVLITPITRKKK